MLLCIKKFIVELNKLFLYLKKLANYLGATYIIFVIDQKNTKNYSAFQYRSTISSQPKPCRDVLLPNMFTQHSIGKSGVLRQQMAIHPYCGLPK